MGRSKPRKNNSPTSLFGLARTVRKPSGKSGYEFLWGRIAAVLATLGVLGYVGLFTALFFYYKYQRGYEEAGYFSTLFIPFRWDAYQEERGDYEIRRAIELVGEGEHAQAFTLLNYGVARSPENLEGRALLAEYFNKAYKRPDIAIQRLEDGLPYMGNNVDYLKVYLNTLFEIKADQKVIEFASDLLKKDVSDEMEGTLAYSLARAYSHRGRLDTAADTVLEYNIQKEEQGLRLLAAIYWESEQPEKALELLKGGINQFETNNLIYADLINYYRKLENYEQARHYCIRRGTEFPLAVGPRIDLLYLYHLTGDERSASREVAAIIKQFSNDEKAHVLLAKFAGRMGDPFLAERLYQRAIERGFNIQEFALELMIAYNNAGQYQNVIDLSEQLQAENASWLSDAKNELDYIRAIAYCGLGNLDMCDVYLGNLLDDNANVRAETFVTAADEFEKMHQYERARKLLAYAYDRNPNNQILLVALVDNQLSAGNSTQLGNYLDKLLTLRQPSTKLLRRAYSELGQDRFIFTTNQEQLRERIADVLDRI